MAQPSTIRRIWLTIGASFAIPAKLFRLNT